MAQWKAQGTKIDLEGEAEGEQLPVPHRAQIHALDEVLGPSPPGA